ncbi:MAG: DUF885 domain-containing protein [Proteobacteria bacterium]|nr:DUF885 domain-containing protein [Pseudomonadota bacterium]
MTPLPCVARTCQSRSAPVAFQPMRTLILACLILTSCVSTRNLTDPDQSRLNALNRIMDEYFETSLALNPLFASSIGDHRYDADLAITVSEEYRAKSRAAIEDALKRIHKLGCVDLPESSLYSCLTFETELTNSLNLMKADLDPLMSFNQFSSFFLDFAEVASGSSYVTFDTAADYRNFISRMNKVPAVLKAAEDKMREGLKKKIVIPRALALKGIKQLKNLLNAKKEENVFYKPLSRFPGSVTEDEKKAISPDYEKAILESAVPAYRRFLSFIEKDYLPHTRKSSGIGALPGGKEYYLALARNHTTTTLTPDEIHALGLKEVARIRGELEAVKKELGFKGKLTDFFKSLRTDPALYPFKTHEAVLDAYEKIHQTLMAKIPEHFHLLPQARFEIREVEKFKADTSGEAYQNPSEDGKRPGIFWVPIPDPAKYPKKSMEALFLHEAIPGHHFQIALQQELDLPRYRKFNGNNAFVEGWGLYAESLGAELGIYRDPYSRIGRLEYEMHRALRLVVDTGMHWKGWSREKAIAYCLENEPMGKNDIVTEIERYMAIPGQALAYKIGELKLQELKAWSKSLLKERFRDADFHDAVLEAGPLPLSVLESRIHARMEALNDSVSGGTAKK